MYVKASLCVENKQVKEKAKPELFFSDNSAYEKLMYREEKLAIKLVFTVSYFGSLFLLLFK